MATTPIFEPDDTNELLRGWLLHAHKGRDRHDLAARRCDRQRYLIGIPATIAAAVVGTSVFAALDDSPSRPVQILVGVLAVLSAILASLQAFLNLGARAERHRIAGVKYKTVIRRMEQMGIGTIREVALDAPVLNELRESLDALEEEMPVVAPSVYDLVETKYRDTDFVDSVIKATKSKRTSEPGG